MPRRLRSLGALAGDEGGGASTVASQSAPGPALAGVVDDGAYPSTGQTNVRAPT